MYSRVWTIRWWPVVRGASRHSWQQGSINVSSKGVESRGVQRKIWKSRIKDYGLGVLGKATLLPGFGEQVRVVLLPGFGE